MTALPMTGFHRARITPYGNNTLEIQLLWEVCRRVLRLLRFYRIRCLRIQWADFFPCPGFSPDSLVQLEQECVSVRQRRCCFASSASVRVAHLPQKPVIDSFFIFVFTFPRETTKKDCRFSGSPHPSHTSCFIHSCFHMFDKYQPKSAAERVSCRCNRNLLFACLPFRIDVCFCPREIFTSKR